ncbi:hypothetical protein [Catenulispora subtropica]|uniref:DUF11 domain-containing protein n=1 Tax=Catenulispora subtropica TaxID=450798 RepID=A0ABP5E7H2_9ACTN
MTDLIESEDELLEPQPAPGPSGVTGLAALTRRLRARTPFGGSGADPQRRPRAALAGVLAVALAAGAAAAGVAVHRADLHRERTRGQDRMLLHLLGGGASLAYAGTGARSGQALPDAFDAPLPTDFTIGVRNDGAKALEITAVRIRQPGMDVVDSAPKAMVKPGESVALTTRVAVHCTASDLPRSPTGATVVVRTAADKGKKAGDPIEVPLTFTSGSAEGAVPNPNQSQSYLVGSYVTGNFYHLCANVLAKMPAGISVRASTLDATLGNPVVRYTMHIDGTRGASQIVTASTTAPTMPGVTSETDLKGPLPIGASGVDVAITDRITDCTAFGDYLAIRGGAATAALWLSSVAPLSVEAADPRFRLPQEQRSMMQSLETFGELSDDSFQDALLGQLAAACPAL